MKTHAVNTVIGLFCAVILSISGARAQSPKHPFSIDDWAALRSAAPVSVSPRGEILARITFGGENGPSHREWRIIRPDGTNVRKLEIPEHFTPFGFMPDGGSLYGSLAVNSVPQLAIFGIATLKGNAEPAQIIPLPSGIQTAALSPDGARFAILANPDRPDDLADVHTVVAAEQTSLYVVKTDGTDGKWWCPELKNIGPSDGGFSGTASIAWSPGEPALAVVSATPKIGFHTLRSFLDVCSAAGTRRVAEIPNAVSGIAWGNGGRELVFLSTTTSVLTPDHVWSVPAAGGMAADRTPKLEGSATLLAGEARGKVWVVIARGVETELETFEDGALTPRFRWPSGYIAAPPVSSELARAPDQMAVPVSDPQHTENIAVPSGSGLDKMLQKITTEGDEQIGKVDLGPVRVVQWTNKEGIRLEGIATFPAGYTERRYKFLVLPHGGPEANDLLGLDAFSRIIAGLGYVVLQPQYRGSTGYGAQFLDAIFQHFGDRAYRDVDSATDFAIAQGWADPEKLAIFGWSAGGFMTSWTVTQTHRYKAAIEGAGITDWASFLWTSDVQQIDFDDRWPEKNHEAFARFSAVLHASAVTTPTLILHGAADLRVPTFQGREFFEALLANGKATRMVTYPGSPHFPRLWEQRRDVMREVANWLDTYNK